MLDKLVKVSWLVEEPGIDGTPDVSVIGVLDDASRYVVVGEKENSVGNIEDSPPSWQNEAGIGSKSLGSHDGIVTLARNMTKTEPPAKQNVA